MRGCAVGAVFFCNSQEDPKQHPSEEITTLPEEETVIESNDNESVAIDKNASTVENESIEPIKEKVETVTESSANISTNNANKPENQPFEIFEEGIIDSSTTPSFVEEQSTPEDNSPIELEYQDNEPALYPVPLENREENFGDSMILARKGNYQFFDPGKWSIENENGTNILTINEASKPYRGDRPGNISIFLHIDIPRYINSIPY